MKTLTPTLDFSAFAGPAAVPSPPPLHSLSLLSLSARPSSTGLSKEALGCGGKVPILMSPGLEFIP